MVRSKNLWAISTAIVCAFAAWQVRAETQSVALKHGGLDRPYTLHIPVGYDGKKALPLVMFFHGGFGTATHAANSYGWTEKADKEGFVALFGNGTGNIQTWNAMHGCGSAFRNKIDDLGYVRALIADAKSRVNIDPARIYATGMSNGGMLSHRLAAEMSDVFAAAAPVAGTIGGKENAAATEKRPPAPKSPVPMIIVHGKNDQNVLYDGGPSPAGVERGRVDLSVAESVAFWTKSNGITGAPKKEELDGGNVIKESYASPNGVDVVVYSVVDGGHSWPGARKALRLRTAATGAFSATDAIWEFFASHPKK